MATRLSKHRAMLLTQMTQNDSQFQKICHDSLSRFRDNIRKLQFSSLSNPGMAPGLAPGSAAQETARQPHIDPELEPARSVEAPMGSSDSQPIPRQTPQDVLQPALAERSPKRARPTMLWELLHQSREIFARMSEPMNSVIGIDEAVPSEPATQEDGDSLD